MLKMGYCNQANIEGELTMQKILNEYFFDCFKSKPEQVKNKYLEIFNSIVSYVSYLLQSFFSLLLDWDYIKLKLLHVYSVLMSNKVLLVLFLLMDLLVFLLIMRIANFRLKKNKKCNHDDHSMNVKKHHHVANLDISKSDPLEYQKPFEELIEAASLLKNARNNKPLDQNATEAYRLLLTKFLDIMTEYQKKNQTSIETDNILLEKLLNFLAEILNSNDFIERYDKSKDKSMSDAFIKFHNLLEIRGLVDDTESALGQSSNISMEITNYNQQQPKSNKTNEGNISSPQFNSTIAMDLQNKNCEKEKTDDKIHSITNSTEVNYEK
jgi:hypothetical protein